MTSASSLLGISNILSHSHEDSQKIEELSNQIMAKHGIMCDPHNSMPAESHSSYQEQSVVPAVDLHFGSEDGESDNGGDTFHNDNASSHDGSEMSDTMQTAKEQSEILDYMNILKEAGVDISYYQNKYSDNMSPRDARLLKYQLRATVERSQYTSMFEHVIVGTSLLIEKVFNGKREFLGSKPNMVGWSGSVEQQLRQIRSTTNELVTKTLEKHSISAEKRILVTLAMSALMYQRRPVFATAETPSAKDRYSAVADDADRVLRQQ